MFPVFLNVLFYEVFSWLFMSKFLLPVNLYTGKMGVCVCVGVGNYVSLAGKL